MLRSPGLLACCSSVSINNALEQALKVFCYEKTTDEEGVSINNALEQALKADEALELRIMIFRLD